MGGALQTALEVMSCTLRPITQWTQGLEHIPTQNYAERPQPHVG